MEKYGIFDFSPWKREYPKPAKVDDGTCWGRIWSFQISISCTIEVRGAPYIIYIMIYHIQPGSTNPIPLTQLQVQWSTCTKHFSLHLSVLSSSPSGTQPLSKYVNNESFKKCFNALFSSNLMQGSYFAVSNDFSKTNMTKRPVWRDTIFNRNQRILGICKGSLRCPPEYVLLYREFGGNLWERDSQNRLATEVFFMKRKTQGNLCKHLIDWFHGTMVW